LPIKRQYRLLFIKARRLAFINTFTLTVTVQQAQQ
jgi:hypothetical protein